MRPDANGERTMAVSRATMWRGVLGGLLGGAILLLAGCSGEGSVRFRTAANATLQSGAQQIIDGVISGVFARNK